MGIWFFPKGDDVLDSTPMEIQITPILRLILWYYFSSTGIQISQKQSESLSSEYNSKSVLSSML